VGPGGGLFLCLGGRRLAKVRSRGADRSIGVFMRPEGRRDGAGQVEDEFAAAVVLAVMAIAVLGHGPTTTTPLLVNVPVMSGAPGRFRSALLT
jgi:hypothetical protein